MKKTFTKITSLVLGLSLMIGTGVGIKAQESARTAEAGTESVAASFDYSAQEYSNQKDMTKNGPYGINNDVSVTFKGNAKYYTSGTSVRVYGGASFEINAGTGTLSNITFTYGSSDGSNDITASGGVLENNT